MPSTYSIDVAQRLVTLRYTGLLDGPEHERGIAAAIEDPAWQLGFDWLVDMRSIRALVLTPEDMERMRMYRRNFHDPNSRARTALVVRPVDEDIAVLYATLTKRDLPPGVEREVRVFLRPSDALTWLDTNAVHEGVFQEDAKQDRL